MSHQSEGDVEPQVQRLARNALALATGGVVAQLAFTLLEVLVARRLGAEAYGIFVTAYAWAVLGAFLMELGTPLWTIQEGSRHHERIPTLLGSALAVNLSVFAILYVLIVLVVNTIATNPVLSLLLVVLPYGLILTLQSSLAAVYSSYQTMHINAFFQGLAPVAILLVYFAFALNDISLRSVALAYVLGGAGVTGAWFFMTIRKVRPQTDLASIRATLRSSYQYGMSGILFQVFYKTDIVILSALAGAREAGIYAAAFKLVELVFKVAVLSGRVFAPAVFKASHESDTSFQLLASMMTRFLAIAGLLAGVSCFVLAEDLILLMFGESYAASIPVLRVLGGVMATMSTLIALQLLLSSIDLHFQRVAGLGITVAIHIAACAAIVPRFGAQGAAWATLFSGLLVNTIYACSALRRRSFRFGRWVLAPFLLAAAIAGAAAALDLSGLLATTAAVSTFLLSLLMLRIVQPHEIKFVLRSLTGGKPPAGDSR